MFISCSGEPGNEAKASHFGVLAFQVLVVVAHAKQTPHHKITASPTHSFASCCMEKHVATN